MRGSVCQRWSSRTCATSSSQFALSSAAAAKRCRVKAIPPTKCRPKSELLRCAQGPCMVVRGRYESQSKIQNSLKLRRAGGGAVLGGHASARPLGLAPARRGLRLRGTREVVYRIVGLAPARRGLRLRGSQEVRWRIRRTSVIGSWGLGLLSLLGLKQPWQKLDKVRVFQSRAKYVRQRGGSGCARLRRFP